MNIGIHGIGVYLPEDIRTNDFWPPSVIQAWEEERQRSMMRAAAAPTDNLSPGARLALGAFAKLSADPFQGSRERRIMPDEMLTSDMELIAAQRAIEDSGVPKSEVGLLLSYTTTPDFLNANNACILHEKLGLEQRCFTTSIEAACNSFLMQLTLAEHYIATGRVRYALLVQSCAMSRLAPVAKNYSAWFGDGASAVVVGPVSSNRGVLAASHRTDGTKHRALVYGIPQKRWYEEGRVILYPEDSKVGREMLLGIADRAKQSIAETLAEANIQPEHVDFYASHQGTAWLREVTQQHAGLQNAKHVDTFSWTASLSAANIPTILSIARADNLLAPDSIVTMFAGGSGETWSTVVLRWGS